MSEDLKHLTAAVEKNGSVTQSAVTLLTELASRIRLANSADEPEEAVEALAKMLDEQAQALAAAVLANTPAAPGQANSTTRDSGTGNGAAPDSAPQTETPPMDPPADSRS